ncbi:EscG/YscG/SsaH family type III secretion system needle protein co-chaperone [Pseudomonas aeruginosa]|nr:EscG/YscG/SsaH family type III secretion system needle protein co-chaperone [Pseudomonas aeruginosa]
MKTTQPLDSHTRRLVVAAGLAASNHNLRREVFIIQSALGNLIDDTQARCIVEATMLIGIGQTNAARRLLQDDHSAEAQLLRYLLDSEESQSPTL